MMSPLALSVPFKSADIDEKAIRMEDPKELVMTLVEAKADAILSKLKASGDYKGSEDEQPILLITADQVGTMDSMMGLPKALTEKLIQEALHTSLIS